MVCNMNDGEDIKKKEPTFKTLTASPECLPTELTGISLRGHTHPSIKSVQSVKGHLSCTIPPHSTFHLFQSFKYFC